MAPSSRSSKDIPNFTRLNANISLHRPSSTSLFPSPSDPTAPTLIVYCTWMGAAPRHVAKYTAGYREKFPESAILWIQSFPRDIWMKPDLSPAVEVVLGYLQQQTDTKDTKDQKSSTSSIPPQPNIALIALSNGGSLSAMNLCTRLLPLHPSPPFTTLLLECTPSLPRLAEGARAFAAPLSRTHSGVYYTLLFALFAFLLWVLSFASTVVLRREDLLLKMRRELIELRFLVDGGRRMYLYSKADRMVPWRDVKDHVESVRSQGEEVEEVVFEEAGHVALLVEDEVRYWAAIEGFLRR